MALGTAYGVILVSADYLPAAELGDSFQFQPLIFGGLPVRRYPQVQRNSFLVVHPYC